MEADREAVKMTRNVYGGYCRAERMVAFDNTLADTDCYTLMIIDFLKSCGVEVEDEH